MMDSCAYSSEHASTCWPIGRNVTIIARVDVLVGLLIDLRTDPIIGFVPGIGVDVLAGADTNIVAAAMTDLEFTQVSLEI